MSPTLSRALQRSLAPFQGPANCKSVPIGCTRWTKYTVGQKFLQRRVIESAYDLPVPLALVEPFLSKVGSIFFEDSGIRHRRS
jgi:hypothetical protein